MCFDKLEQQNELNREESLRLFEEEERRKEGKEKEGGGGRRKRGRRRKEEGGRREEEEEEGKEELLHVLVFIDRLQLPVLIDSLHGGGDRLVTFLQFIIEDFSF